MTLDDGSERGDGAPSHPEVLTVGRCDLRSDNEDEVGLIFLCRYVECFAVARRRSELDARPGEQRHYNEAGTDRDEGRKDIVGSNDRAYLVSALVFMTAGTSAREGVKRYVLLEDEERVWRKAS